ncbi:M48 family metallopeptidase [Pseudoalteromonas sp. JBTF-M23]|uniref:M48 family metallopeptidase n=1 Tax=Pseudoalteromonas caenipelagi TaxID=2726988 RepID=A0A849V7P1_9GAMM|nr:YgjP-like metallopeptidase domain-containing protein [Pseudoalteromonas caenipelagi]NOU49569.1 M48 family metallopeptidase [Pseudoalteromonas caenipelagi]
MDFARYFVHYPEGIQSQVEQLITSGQLKQYFERKYPNAHQLQNEKALYEFTNQLKQRYLKNAPKLNSVKYKKQADLVKNALGTHTFKSHQHGGKLKAKHEIAIAAQLKQAPEALLKVLVVHELAHFKEKDHNKAFYQLCCHMEPDYHQLELDLRLFLVLQELELSFY